MQIHVGRRSLFLLGTIAGALLASAGVAVATGQLIGEGGIIQGCYRFEADSAETVGVACERAALRFERVIEAVDSRKEARK